MLPSVTGLISAALVSTYPVARFPFLLKLLLKRWSSGLMNNTC